MRILIGGGVLETKVFADSGIDITKDLRIAGIKIEHRAGELPFVSLDLLQPVVDARIDDAQAVMVRHDLEPQRKWGRVMTHYC